MSERTTCRPTREVDKTCCMCGADRSSTAAATGYPHPEASRPSSLRRRRVRAGDFRGPREETHVSGIVDAPSPPVSILAPAEEFLVPVDRRRVHVVRLAVKQLIEIGSVGRGSV